MRSPENTHAGPSGVFLTAPQAAQRAGKTRQTIERWARTGRVRARRVGRDWLISAASLDRVSQR